MKIKFLGLSALMLLMTVVSCQKDVKNPVETQPRYADAGDGGLDVLGYGYDMINGRFASAESATRRIVNVRKLKAELPARIHEIGGTYVDYQTKSGEDYEKFQKQHIVKVDVKTGIKIFGLSLFKADFKSSFDQTTLKESTRSFASVDMLVKTASLEILNHNLSYDYLKNYLDTDFVNACNTLTPEQLVNLYGVGMIKKMDVGGKLSLDYSSVVSNGDKKTIVTAGGSAAFKFLFKVDVSPSYEYHQQDVNKNTNQKMVYRSVGGTGAIGITQGSLTQPAAFNPSTWSSTVNRNTSVLINFSDDSFILLHELIPNAEKAKLVRDLIYEKLGMVNKVYSQGKLLAKIWGSPNLNDYAFTSFELFNTTGYNSHNQADYIMSHNVILNGGGTTYDNEFAYSGVDAYKFSEGEASRKIGVKNKNLNPALKYKVSYKYRYSESSPIPNFNSYQITELPPAKWDDYTWYQARKTISGVTSFEECCFVSKIVDDYVVYPEGSKVELYIYDRYTGSIKETLVFD
ncbi:hypothetical protein [Sphingobacterium wenxiniae]|uniref:MAC/Perforin domain-containing protein n=1 Tax=Sphingobacterium wenxiniae TaxID=683125 RepID=A0A1I6W027_9SPHI|nr:hypothetical protein [Sphingobacterium wenxiniae]SFT19121.1 hypothetical protein SAMN05660206_1212 [Sphingobacterium wenxiniae]